MNKRQLKATHEDIENTLEILPKLYKSYKEQTETRYKVSLMIALEHGARDIVQEAMALQAHYLHNS